MRRAAGWLAFAGLVSAGPAAAGTLKTYDTVDPLPALVAAQVTCDRVNQSADRIPFAGGVLFKAQCPGNNANYVQGFVFAEDAGGKGAKALLFPRPGPKGALNPLDSLSNTRLDPARAELTELSVNPETDICRTEGRWRLAGKARRPVLVFWRQTRDCDGRTGWRVLVDRRGRN